MNRKVVLKPQSTMTCFVRARQQRHKVNQTYLLSRIDTGVIADQPGVYPLEGIVSIRNTKKFPIQFINNTSVKVRKGTMIAKLEEVNSVCSINSSLLHEINEAIDPTANDSSNTHSTPAEFKKPIDNLMKEFDDVFAKDSRKLPATDLVEMEINLSDSTPIFIPPYGFHYTKKQAVDEAISDLLEAYIIRHSSSPYNALLIVISKAKDNSIRLVQYYRSLNSKTKSVAMPLHNIDQILSCLTGANFFSKLDMRKAFHCIRLKVVMRCKLLS